MGTSIHPTAVVDSKAQIADGVEIGPYSVIGPDVRIGEGSVLLNHVTVIGHTHLGRECQIFPGAVVGGPPQDLKYKGGKTTLEIGDYNIIRECCTLNPGTELGGGRTVVGDHNLIMAYVHIAHDCQVGNQTIFANNASLAGHVTVGDYVILGGFTLVYQFCSLGPHSLTAYGSGISLDVPPYVTVGGSPARPHGLNMEGLRRRGFPEAVRKVLKQAYKTLYRENRSLQDAIAELKGRVDECAELEVLVSFLETRSRGIVR